MTGTYIKGDENFNFTFKTNPTMSEKLGFVSSVTDVLVGENYLSMLRDMVFDFYIISMFTDVDITSISNADNSIDKIEELLEETNIVDIVKANIDSKLLDELNEAVDNNIEYKTGIHKNALNEALSSLIKTLESKIEGVDTKAMMDLAGALSGVGEELTMDNLVQSYISSGVLENK